jgi:AMP-binding enzyme
MILGPPQHQKTAGAGGRITLDDLFRAAVAQRPDHLALVDPPHREAFTTGAPRRLTYAQADRAVSAIAARLRRDGLARDEVVALQMPNTVEAVLALLGVLRAGLIASPMPLLWRHADCNAAIAAAGARALITMGRVGATDHGALAAAVAAHAPTMEHVYVLGGAGDGTASLDDTLAPDADATSVDAAAAHTESEPAAYAHVAVVTWEVAAAGLVPVARSHAEVVMAGLEPMLEGRFEPKATILSSLCLGSAAAVAATLVPWLLSHATLALHHPFDPLAMRQQILDLGCHTAIMPGSLAARAAEASMFADSEVRQVIALWRNPERLAAGASWQPAWPDLIDVLAFGEAGLMAAIRNADGRPAGLIPGPMRRTPDKGPLLIEASRTREGTLALRGPMVPRFPFPPGAAPGMRLAVDANGFLDTFYPCRAAGSSGALTVTGPPAGVVSMGGYRFILAGLQEAVSQLEPGAMLAAFPDGLAGQRVAGIAVRRDAIRDALAELGLNPLVINAFRPRRSGETRDAA